MNAPTLSEALRKYLTRHGRDDLVAPLLANDESERIARVGGAR